MRGAVFLCALLLLGAGAAAQPAKNSGIETVIVNGIKPHSGVTPGAVAHDFVKSFAAPTALRDAIARWETPICPQFLGVAPNFASVMEAHFRAIAAQAGAPVKAQGCRPNLLVVVTPQPQDYLDALHKKNVEALGYHGARTVSHPVQGWYVTGIRDNRGKVYPDRDGEVRIELVGVPPHPEIVSTSTAVMDSVGGWRDHPDLSSDLLYVTILVDAEKTAGYTVGEIADYVAMMALSRTEDYGDCQLMPSITNLLSPCDDKLKPSQITPTDIAYLRGVYRMDPGAKLQIQQDQIAAEMTAALAGGK